MAARTEQIAQYDAALQAFATMLQEYPLEQEDTKYAYKRRMLREHRRNMRVMDELIIDHGLAAELEERLDDNTGNTNFFLGYDSDMDESSDAEDPEATLRDQVEELREEARNKKDFVEAIADHRGVKRHFEEVTQDLEHAKMCFEDTQGLRGKD